MLKKIILVVVLATLPTFAGVKDSCQGFYSQAFPKLKFETAPEKDKLKNLNSTEIGYVAPILDQGRRGFCWLYSTFSNLTHRAIKRIGYDPKLSLHYVSYFHWTEQAIQSALNINATGVQEGGNFHLAINYLRKFGAATEEQWKAMGGSTSVQLPKNNAAELPQVAALLEKSHVTKSMMEKWLRPEISMAATSEQITQQYLNFYMENGTSLMQVLEQQRKGLKSEMKKEGITPNQKVDLELMSQLYTATVNGVRELTKSKRALARGEITDAQFKTIVSELKLPMPVMGLTRAQVDMIMKEIDSNIAQEVVRVFNHIYFGKDTSPMDEPGFDMGKMKAQAAEFFPEVNDKMIYFFVSEDRKQKPALTEIDGDIGVISISSNDLLKVIHELHKAKLPVSLIYDHQGDFVKVDDPVDLDSDGFMSIKRVNFAPIKAYTAKVNRNLRGSTYQRGGHLVVSIATHTYKDGKIAALGIANSWSEKVGNNGRFTMMADYAGGFMDGIGIFGNDLLQPNVLALLGDNFGGVLEKAFQNPMNFKPRSNGPLKSMRLEN